MAPLTYASRSLSLGDDSLGVTKSKAAVALKGMQKSLAKWLGYRNALNAAAGGAEPPRFWRRPGVKPLPAAVISQTLRQERFETEQRLANSLHALLTECGAQASSLPAPDVAQDPDAAAKLAEIAISGRCPGDVGNPVASGLIWWVFAIPVAGAVLIASQWITSQADIAKEQEHTRCIQSGACTDYGFWLKMAGVAVIGWMAWDKFGLREAVRKARAP